MKNTFLAVFFFCATQIAFNQSCDATFYYYDRAFNNTKAQITVTDALGFWVGTSSPETSPSYSDMTLIRADAFGNEIWRKNFGTPNKSDKNKNLIATRDGHVLFAGDGNNQIRLVKVANDGTVIWQKTYGETGKQYEVNHIHEDVHGNILIAGQLFKGTAKSVLALKLDKDGFQLKKMEDNPLIAQWVASSYPARFGFSTGLAITDSNDGGYLLSGSSIYSDQFWPQPANVLVYKLDANLAKVWNKDFFGSFGCYSTLSGQAIFQEKDNNILVGVKTDGYCLDGGSPSQVLYKLDANGNKLEEKIFEKGGLNDLYQTADGNFISNSDYSNFAKINPDGELLFENWFQYEISLGGKNAVVEFPDKRLGFAGSKSFNGSKTVVVITDSLGNHCKNRLGGYVYYDQNNNCKRDAAEPGLTNKLLELGNGPEYTLTDPNGHYLFVVDTGLKNIKAFPTAFPNQASDFWQITCPASGIRSFASPTPYQKPDTLNFALTPADRCPVFQIKSSLSSTRVCNKGRYQVEICNDGSLDADNTLVKLKFPAALKFLNANFPYVFDGIVHTFDLGALKAGQCKTLFVDDSIRCDAIFGNTICIDIAVEGSPSCAIYSYTRTDRFCRVLSNSYDPNDITGWIDNRSPCFGSELLGKQASIDYTIRFQNTGNDTAYRVVVIDTLPAGKFDIKSYRPGLSSHPYTLDFRYDNILIWTFYNINLTDSLTDVVKSQGFVTFRIKTASPLVATDKIANKAAIYFDANPPVITKDNILQKCAVTTGQASVSGARHNSMAILPNPAQDYTILQFDYPLTDPANINVYNNSGVLVAQFLAPKGVSKWQMDTRKLQAGMYYLSVDSADLKYFKNKLIIIN